LLQELETLKREVQRRQQQNANESASKIASLARDVHGVKVVSAAVEHASRDDLERLVDAIRQDLGSGVVVLGSVEDGRVQFVAGVTRDLTARVHAGNLIKEVAGQAGGGGGGRRPDFATGGGTQPAKLPTALQYAYTVVDNALQKG
jgi:alanyl-tRNA synthetase